MPCGGRARTSQLKFTLNSDGLVKKGIEFKAGAEAFDVTSGAVLLTIIMQTEDCMGDALRGQGKGKGKGQLKFTLNSDGLVNEGIELKAEAEAFDGSSDAMLITNIMQTEGCMGDALWGQGKGKSQLKLALISDGTLGFTAPGGTA